MWEENTLKLLHPPTVNQVNLDNKESKVSESFIYLSQIQKWKNYLSAWVVPGLGEHHLGFLVAFSVASLHLAVKEMAQVSLIGYKMVLCGSLHMATPATPSAWGHLARMIGGGRGRRGFLDHRWLLGVQNDQGGSLVAHFAPT